MNSLKLKTPKYKNNRIYNKELLFNKAKNIRMIVFDFDGVFTDNRVLTLQDGTEGVFCYRGDGIGLEAVKRLGIKLLVLSTETNPIVKTRCQKLEITCIQGCNNKSEILKSEVAKLNIPLKNIAYIGNDINDIDCLKIVGLPACVADSYPEVFKFSEYVTEEKGGYGAVREFCEFIVKAKIKAVNRKL